MVSPGITLSAGTFEPVVSICLPVRNGAAFLGQAIESALGQSFDNFELVISDDASSDGSDEIIAHLAAQDRRIHWQRNPKPVGLFENYNNCIERASGVYVKPFAQDDAWAPHLLERQVEFLNERDDVVLVAAGRVLIDADGHSMPDPSQEFNLVDRLGRFAVYPSEQITSACLFPLVNLIGEPCAVMFRRTCRGTGFSSVFRHIGDLEYWLRILRHGNFGMVHEPLVFFRRHENSCTARNLKQLWVHTDIIHMADALRDRLEALGCPPGEFIEHNLAFNRRLLPKLDNGFPDLTGITQDDDYRPPDVGALKKAFLFSLSMLARNDTVCPDTASQERELRETALRIENAELRLRSLLSSLSWQATRPLREVNKFVSSLTEPEQEFDTGSQNGSALSRQRAYLRYLRGKTKRILESRSWRLTRLLRREEAIHEEGLAKSAGAGHKLPDRAIRPEISTWPGGRLEEMRRSPDSSPAIRPTARAGSRERPYDLIVTAHEATRTGAPMLALALCKSFVQRNLNCLIVFKIGGALLAEFNEYCDILDLSRTGIDLEYELALLEAGEKLLPGTPVLLNSADLYDLAHVFKRQGCHVVSLIHEYLSNYPGFAREEILRNSDFTVFSSQATLRDASRHCKPAARSAVIPQGLLEPSFGAKSRSEGKDFLSRNYAISPSSFVVLSCGNGIQRKGIDIFTLVAGDLLSRSPDPPEIEFVWVGGDVPVTFDSYWWAKYDTRKLGIDKRVHFVGEQSELESFFVGADLFLLCSRQDPMPCVLHMAQAARLPVVAFRQSGGAEEALARGGGRLVPYGDVPGISAAILEYYHNRSLCTADGAAGALTASETYQMSTYIDKLLDLVNMRGRDARAQVTSEMCPMMEHADQ